MSHMGRKSNRTGKRNASGDLLITKGIGDGGGNKSTGVACGMGW